MENDNLWIVMNCSIVEVLLQANYQNNIENLRKHLFEEQDNDIILSKKL